MPIEQALRVFGLNSKALGNKNLIHKRYRDLAKTYHPDKIGNNDMMIQVNLAYEVLKKSKPVSVGKANLYNDLMKAGMFGKGSKVGVYA